MIDESTLKAIHQQATEALLDYRIAEGLHGVAVLMQECADQQLARSLEAIRLDYEGMMDFLAEGGKDEARSSIQKSMMARALYTLDSTSRAIRLQRGEDLYAQAWTRLFATYGPDVKQALRLQWMSQQGMTERYETQDLLFDLLWTMPLWDSRDTADWFEFLSRLDAFTQEHLLGGILLSAWEYFDEEKFTLLQLMCESEYDGVRALAIAGCGLFILRHDKRLKLKDVLRLNLKQEQTASDMRTLQHELILMKESPKVNKAFNQEMSRLDFTKINSPEFHKDIERIMRRYGSTIAMGIDLDLNKATLLHSSRFLRSISHWWAPFDESRPFVQDIFIRKDGELAKGISQMFKRSPDCSVNRYAICEAMMNHVDLTSLDRQIVQFDQMRREEDDEEESDNDNLTDKTETEDDEKARHFRLRLRCTVQNLFRFFVHSPLAGKVENPFELPLMFPRNEKLRHCFRSRHLLDLSRVLIQFQYNDDAFRLLQEVLGLQGASAPLLRMIGQCLQNSHRFDLAVHYYSQADLIEENDPWTLGQMELCYVQLRQYDKLWKILLRLDALTPDDNSIARRMVGCLIMQDKHAEALNYLHKLELSDPSDPTTLTQIAVSSAYLERFDTARKYLRKREETGLPMQKEERLMAGSVHFAEGTWDKALAYFQQADLAAYDAFQPRLLALGISVRDIRLMRDMILRGRE